MNWSECLDNVSSYAYLDGELVIVLALRRDFDRVYVAKIPPDQFVATTLDAVGSLDVR